MNRENRELICGLIAVFVVAVLVVFIACKSNFSQRPEITSNTLPTKCCICGKEILGNRVTIVLDNHWYVFCTKCYKSDSYNDQIKWQIEWYRETIEKLIKERSRPYKVKVVKKLIDELQ